MNFLCERLLTRLENFASKFFWEDQYESFIDDIVFSNKIFVHIAFLAVFNFCISKSFYASLYSSHAPVLAYTNTLLHFCTFCPGIPQLMGICFVSNCFRSQKLLL